MMTTILGGKLYKVLKTSSSGEISVDIYSSRDMLGGNEALDEFHALLNEHNNGVSSLIHFDLKSKYEIYTNNYTWSPTCTMLVCSRIIYFSHKDLPPTHVADKDLRIE